MTTEKTKTEKPGPDTKGMNIYQRLAGVRRELGYIQKDKKVQDYLVVTHDMVTAHVRPLLDKYGVITLMGIDVSRVEDTGSVTKAGKKIIRYEARYHVAAVNIDNPEDRFVLLIESHAEDSNDKAPGKAMSYAMKYFFLKTLNIETGEADESRIPGEVPTITKEQALELRKMAEELGAKDPDVTLKYLAVKAFGQEMITDVRADMFERAAELLRAQAEKRRESESGEK